MSGAVRGLFFVFFVLWAGGCLFVVPVIPYVDPVCEVDCIGDTGDTGDTGATGSADCAGTHAQNCNNGDACQADDDCRSTYCETTSALCADPPADTCPQAPRDNTGPVIFFTDVTSGPASGGEDDLGVFVTLYGERFSATQGSVTYGGKPVAKIKSWQENVGARGLDRIVVQIGAAAPTGALTVSVGGKVSNAVPFTVRAGRIFFLDVASQDATADGTFAHPHKTLAAAKSTLAAGDTLYVRGGAFETRDPTSVSASVDTNFYLESSSFPPTTADSPVAIVGYPGSPPAIGPSAFTGDTSCMGGGWALSIDPNGSYVENLVIANVLLRNRVYGLYASGNNLRFVDVRIDTRCINFEIGSPHANGVRFYGSTFVDSGGVQGLANFRSSGTDTVRDVDFGWNEILDSADSFSNLNADPSTTTADMRDITFHDNVSRNGFRFGSVSRGAQNVTYYNNVIWKPGAMFVSDFTGTMTFEHNSFFSTDPVFSFGGLATSGTIALKNNIFATGQVIPTGREGQFGGASNLWQNQAIPAFDATGISVLPGYVDPAVGDLRLLPSSSARGKGSAPTRCMTFDGTRRTATPDLGAF